MTNAAHQAAFRARQKAKLSRLTAFAQWIMTRRDLAIEIRAKAQEALSQPKETDDE